MTEHTKLMLINTRKNCMNVLIKLIAICFGALLTALAYNALLLPYGLLTGGVSGIALIGKYIYDIPVYFSILILNIPIFILGYKELDRAFILYSLVGTLVMIIGLPLTKPFVPDAHLDIFLASVFSGVVNGFGLGIILRFGASTGGNDILAVIMKKRADIPVGTFSFFANLIILFSSLLIFNLDILLYSMISIWVAGQTLNFVLEGINRKKSIMIVSEKAQQISERILKEVHRGITYLNGEGGYTGCNRLIINTVVNNFENAKIREIIQDIDPNAFIYITEVIEVSGRGFTIRRKEV